MANFNKVILAGNLTRDPEMRYTAKGMAIAACSLAINRTWKGEDGQQHEEVTFVDFDAWGRVAEVIGQYFKKGRPILVEGRLKLDQWDDKQTGQKRSRLKVTCETFQFLESGGERDGGSDHGKPRARGQEAPPQGATGGYRGNSRPPAQQATSAVGHGGDAADDDVPF